MSLSADVNESDAAVSDDQQTESTEPDGGESTEQGTASNAPAGNDKLQTGNDKPQTGNAGGTGDDEYKYAINVQNFKLSADKNTITATAKGAKYSADVTLNRTDETKFGLWGGNDLAAISAEEFAKLVTIIK